MAINDEFNLIWAQTSDVLIKVGPFNPVSQSRLIVFVQYTAIFGSICTQIGYFHNYIVGCYMGYDSGYYFLLYELYLISNAKLNKGNWHY